VYPNPVGDSFTIALSNDTLFGGNVSVFAKDGRLVGSISVPAGEKKVQMNTIGLQKGIYLVKINIDGDVSIQKMVKK
jgi:sugar lactone lactonase YvrE